MAITGLTSSTPEKLLLDAGAFYKNYDFTKTYDKQDVGSLIGATAGGGSFSAVPQVRKIEVDGGKTNVKQLEVIDGWVVTMTANVKEVTATTLELALGAFKETDATEAGITGCKRIVGKENFESTDYAENLTWVGKLSGSEKPVIVSIKNAMCLNGLSLTMADKSEAVIPVTVTGHYDLSDLDTPPFEIIYPL